MKILLPIFLSLFFSPLFGQGEGPTVEDYQRAHAFLKDHFRQKVHNAYVQPQFFADSTGLWFELSGKGTRSFKRVDFPSLSPKPAFDHQKFAQALNSNFDLDVKADSLPISRLEFKGDQLEFRERGQAYQADLTTYQIKKLEPGENDRPSFMEAESPDGKWVAFSRDYNLFIRSTETGKEIQLSKDGKRHYEYASYYGWGDIMVGENGKRPDRFTASWSPDSKKILSSIVDTRKADKMYMLDWSVDSLFRPRLLGYYRGSPGDSTMVYIQTVLFDIEKQKQIAVGLPPKVHIVSPDLRWMPDSERLVGRHYIRGYKQRDYVEVDASTGKTRVFYSESSETSVNNAFDRYRLLKDLNKIIFTAEMTGWNHLYLLDVATGKHTQLTDGNWMVNDLAHVDEQNQMIYFTAMGKESGRNIYFQHLYSVDFEGKKVSLLTPEDAHHEISFSPDGGFFVDNYATVTEPTVTILRKSGKSDKKELSRADASALFETGWKAPETHIIKAEDGVSDIYCVIWKPTNFDPQKSYPVVEYSYTGPFTFRYPRSFRRSLSSTNQSLAELGFIVVTIDGRGSAGRSKAFRDFSYKRLGYLLGDHVYAHKQLGERFSWYDADRVGIFGHSAGGYDAAHGMLQYPDHYKVAVSSSADHDHRMEKAWWPEMYMGWPVDTAYHNQSNITMAGNLQGKILLVHGGIDENVNPSATFKLSEALIKADKDFDLLIIPSQRHGYRGIYSDYFTKKRWNYFVEHLMGAEPKWSF